LRKVGVSWRSQDSLHIASTDTRPVADQERDQAPLSRVYLPALPAHQTERVGRGAAYADERRRERGPGARGRFSPIQTRVRVDSLRALPGLVGASDLSRAFVGSRVFHPK
jgi:hypothetical protein